MSNYIIEYIRNAIIPRDNTEFITVEKYDQRAFDSLKQDGIMIISNAENSHSDQIPFGIDWVTIGNIIICRKNVPKQLEWLNEDGTFSFDLSIEPIYRRMIPPPWETVDHPFIISNIMKETSNPNSTYIEYGVSIGDSIERISMHVQNVYGVDIINYQPINSNIQFYRMTTDEFSETHLPNIEYDYAFIDADHSSTAAYQNFVHLFRYIKLGGYIFLHDTYPCIEENLLPRACNDCYLTPMKIRQNFQEHIEMLTLPFNPGLTIVRKIK